jgi:hypothetical protein
MKIALLILKLTITASLCIWLFTRVDLQALQEGLARLGAIPIVLGVMLHVAVVILSALRWWILLQHTHAAIPFFRAFPSYYLGVFFNNFLPTGFGGDTVRILHMRIHGVSMKSLVSASVVDRSIGFATIFIVGLFGVVVTDELRIPNHSKIILFGLFLGCLSAAGWLLSRRGGRLIESLGKKYRHTRVRSWILDVLRTCYSYRAEKTRILLALAITTTGYALVILTYYLLGRGLGLDISVTTYIVTIPAIFLAASLPISIGGLGIREGTLVAMLVAAGADFHLAITLSLLYLIVLWLSTLPGALVPLLSRTGKITVS